MTIKKFRNYSKEKKYDLTEDTFYKSIIFGFAHDKFIRGNYFGAVKYFKDSVKFDKGNIKLNDFYSKSKNRLIHKLANYFGFFGLAFLFIGQLLPLKIEMTDLAIDFCKYLGGVLIFITIIVKLGIKSPATNKVQNA